MRRFEWKTYHVSDDGETASLLKSGPVGTTTRWCWMATAINRDSTVRTIDGSPALHVALGTARTKLGALSMCARALAEWGDA